MAEISESIRLSRYPTSTPMDPPITLMTLLSPEELREDIEPLGPDRHADADLARPLGHRDEHDVGDADPADDQADPGDAVEDQFHDVKHLVEPLEQILPG